MLKAIATSVALVLSGLGVYGVNYAAAASAQPVFAQQESGFKVTQNTDTAPASRRVELSPEMKALRTELWLKFPDTISGMWVENDPGDVDHGRVYVSATAEDVLRYVKSKDASIRVERARYSHKELVAKKQEIENRLKTVGVGEGAYVEIDEDDNEVRVYLGDRHRPKPGTSEPVNLAELRNVKVELESQGEIVDVTDDRYDDNFHDDDFDDDWDDWDDDDHWHQTPQPPQAAAPAPPAAPAPVAPAEPPADSAPHAPAPVAPAAPAPAAPAPAPAKPAPAKPAPAKPARPAKPVKPNVHKPNRWDDDDDDDADDRYDLDDDADDDDD